MLHTDVTGLLKARPDERMLKQLVVTPARHTAEPRALDLGEGGGVAIEGVQAQQGLGRTQAFGVEIGDNDLARRGELRPVIAIAGAREGAQPLLRMRLEDGGQDLAPQQRGCRSEMHVGRAATVMTS